MIDDELSRLQKSELRDYAEDARLERVWQRLDAEFVAGRRPSRLGVFVVPALGLALFAAGVFVGRSSLPTREASPDVRAEAQPPTEPVREARPAARAAEPPSAPPSTDHRRVLQARPGALDVTPKGSEAPPVEALTHSFAKAEPPDWQQKADVGDFAGARAAITRGGGWDIALVSASPEQLMALVDVARASSEREQAVRALRRLLNAYGGAPEAPLAAWTLGNLLEQGGDRVGAGEAYALYRRLSPTGDFAEDAAAREVDVALSQGNVERAAELIDEYAKDFPNARRLSELREELAKLQAEPDDVAPSKPVEEPVPADSAAADAPADAAVEPSPAASAAAAVPRE